MQAVCLCFAGTAATIGSCSTHQKLCSRLLQQCYRNILPIRSPKVCGLPSANPGQVCQDDSSHDMGHPDISQGLLSQGLHRGSACDSWLHRIPVQQGGRVWVQQGDKPSWGGPHADLPRL